MNILINNNIPTLGQIGSKSIQDQLENIEKLIAMFKDRNELALKCIKGSKTASADARLIARRLELVLKLYRWTLIEHDKR